MDRAFFKGGATVNMAVVTQQIEGIDRKINSMMDVMRQHGRKFDGFNEEAKSDVVDTASLKKYVGGFFRGRPATYLRSPIPHVQ